MANVPTDPPVSRTIDFGALVRKLLGDEYHKHEKVYKLSGGRTFESSDYGTQGVYRAVSAIVRSGTASGGSPSSIILGTEANGGAGDYVGKRITAVDFATTTFTGTIVGYTESSREARVVPEWGANFVLHTGTAQDGTNTSLTLGTGAPTVLEGTLSLTSGAGSTQERAFTPAAYNGSTKVVNVSKWDAPYLVVGDGSTDEGAQATFYLDFPDLGSGAVDTTPAFSTVSPTFTRATTATTVDSTGMIVSVATGTARSYYDPTTLEYLGYLAEGVRTNVLTKSEQFDDAVWTTVTNVTVGANVAMAPDGASTADSMTDDSTNGSHRIFQSYTFAASAHTLSCFFKKSTHDWVQLLGNDGSKTFAGNFNLSTGTVGQTVNATSSIKSYPNGWYRCSVSITAGSGGGGNIQVAMLDSDGGSAAPSYVGTGTVLYLWGIQLEAAPFTSSYIPTTTASVTRNADVLTYADVVSDTVGTIIAQAGPVLWGGTTGTTQELIGSFLFNPNNAPTQIRQTDGTSQVTHSGISSYFTTQAIFASAWADADRGVTANGASPTTSATFDGAMQTTGVFIGCAIGSVNQWFGPIRRVAYWPQRLLNATLQAITDEATDPEFDPSTFPVALPGSTTVYKVEDEAPGVNTTYSIST